MNIRFTKKFTRTYTINGKAVSPDDPRVKHADILFDEADELFEEADGLFTKFNKLMKRFWKLPKGV